MTRIGLIDYGMGNLHSVRKALEHVGANVTILKDAQDPDDFDRLVLPGVGSLGDCMEGLNRHGFATMVREWISGDRPFLGICLGLQALFDYSEENDANGLGIFPGKAIRFRLPQPFKVPHIGWNQVSFQGEDPMTHGLHPSLDQFYFDHSFHVIPEDPKLIWGTTDHGGSFVCAIRKGRCYATQFHPEKSQTKGLALFRNFVEMPL